MSVLFLSHAFNAKVGNSLRKLILLKLCDNAGDNGECWPSVGHIARQCEASRRAVIGHLQALEADGFIRTEARFVAGAQRSNVYTVNLKKLMDCSLGNAFDEGGERAKNKQKPAKDGVQDMHGGGAGYARGGAADAPGGVQEMHTEPSLRTVIEPSIEYLGAAPKKQSNDLAVIEPKKSKAVNSLDYSKWPSMPKEGLLADWLKIRKAKRLTNTQTAIDAIGGELHSAVAFGFTVDQCIFLAVKKSWGGFEAQWLINLVNKGELPHPRNQNTGGGLVVANGGRPPVLTGGKTRDVPIEQQVRDRSWAKQ